MPVVSSCFVGLNLPFNFLRVSVPVGPRFYEILSAKSRVSLQQVGFTRPEPPSLYKEPHGDSCANDARLATADVRSAVDAGKVLVELGNEIAHEPGFLGPGQPSNQVDRLFEYGHRYFRTRGRCKNQWATRHLDFSPASNRRFDREGRVMGLLSWEGRVPTGPWGRLAACPNAGCLTFRR